MTIGHSQKTAIRERMSRTGESYTTARRNLQAPPSLHKRTPGTFTAATTWQGDFDWDLEIKVHGFRTLKEAANFAGGIGSYSAGRLRLQEGALILHTPSGQEIPLAPENIEVSRMTAAGYQAIENNGMLGPEHFERVNIQPKDFHLEPGLSKGFDSLAYGVEDHLGRAVIAKCDDLDTVPPEGDITCVRDLLTALNKPGGLLIQAPGLPLEERDWIIHETAAVVDEGIVVEAIKQRSIEREGDASKFRISPTGRDALASYDRAVASLENQDEQ